MQDANRRGTPTHPFAHSLTLQSEGVAALDALEKQLVEFAAIVDAKDKQAVSVTQTNDGC